MPRLRTNGHASPKPRPVANGHPGAAPRTKRSPWPNLDAAVLASRMRPQREMPSLREQAAAMQINPFHFDPSKLHPPGVVPPAVLARMREDGANGPAVALDSALELSAPAIAWAGQVYASAFAEGLTFLGYTYLAELAQRPEYRVISEIPAEEMTRKWIRLESADETNERKAKDRNEDDDGEYASDRSPESLLAEAALSQRSPLDRPKVDNGGSTDKSKKIKELDDYLRHIHLQRRCKQFAADDGFFGRSHLYIDIDDAYKVPAELALPIGDGFDAMSKAKVRKGAKIEIRNVEPVWCYPTAYNANDPLAPDWYSPAAWFAMAKQTHRTRMLTGIGRPVPDMLKPAYSFGGLSLSQMAKPYVDNWLRTRQSVADLLHAFTVFALSTDLSTLIMNDGAQLFRRAELFNNLRDNRGLFMINEGSEKLENISVPLGTLDALQAQTQEHMAAVARTPLVKLLGIQPMGLNADSEGVMRAFYDTIHGQQEWLLRPVIHPIVGFAQLALWGEVDPEINFIFEPLKELDEKGEAEVRKIEAETDTIQIDSGVIDAAEARSRLAKDPGSPYHGIDPDDVPEPPEPEMPPGMGGGGEGGDNPGGNTPDSGRGGGFDAIAPFLVGHDEWREGDHPRGQPGNAGQFGPGGGGGGAGAEKPTKNDALAALYQIGAGVRLGRESTSGVKPLGNGGSIEVVQASPAKQGISGEGYAGRASYRYTDPAGKRRVISASSAADLVLEHGFGSAKKPPAPPAPSSDPAETTTFKSKKENAGALLERGTTAKELMATLGWPSISVPATARGLGMKLTKEKRGKETFYTGVPMTAAERQAAGIAAEGAPRKKGGPAARDPETWSLMEYIASRGGIDPKDALIGDVRSMLGTKNKFVPGFGSLIRPGGLRLDKMREAVVEAGYIRDEGRNSPDRQATTTIASLLEALDTENRGQRIYREGRDGGAVAAESERVREENMRHYDEALDEAMSAAGMPPESVTGEQRRRVLELMDRGGVSDPLEALEREAMEWTQNAAERGTVERIPDDLPGWDVRDDTRPASSAGGVAAPF